jgi:GT2 family glycosyltransferase
MSESVPARLSVVMVTFNSRESVLASLPPLRDELEAGDEIVVVDNASDDGTPEAVSRITPDARLIRNESNEGYAAACNSGASAASGELLVFLNPDAVAAPGFRAAIQRPLLDGRGWDAWMGLVTAGGQEILNSDGGVIHFTGIAWAGGAGRPLSEASPVQHEVPFASGACLAIRRETWSRLGGYPPAYFMYHEDVDLSLRLHLGGHRVGIEPTAVVDHAYEFAKGSTKWRLLERNRWATIVRTYPAPLIALLVPALLATELVIVLVAILQGWGRQKLLAIGDVLGALPRLLGERRAIQSDRKVGAAGFATWLTADLSSDFLGRAARLAPLRWALRAYWSGVRALLEAFGR